MIGILSFLKWFFLGEKEECDCYMRKTIDESGDGSVAELKCTRCGDIEVQNYGRYK